MKNNSDKTSTPLLYIVQPNLPPHQDPQMQQVFRTKGSQQKSGQESEWEGSEFFKIDQPQTKESALNQEEKEDEQKKKEEEEKLEKIKREYGVYDALKEISDEIASVQKIKAEQFRNETPVSLKIANENEEDLVDNQPQFEVSTMLEKLSRYPAKAKKPTCEATVKGKRISFRVLNKRKDVVIVQEGEHIYDLHVSDIQDLRVL
ncbi:hypothetical protein [Bacillus sp. V5-8f]|uniref:hypothetical protein n=1 Tax=Bacillus sp. V5-8f TaxID=2053044 RepID=UPI000C76C239|nr:hypothetical protein [Bacillus sp. V5-8f]PLT33895.1 hypothetical protein CUU64_12350 [Bacillus sp. V5-8f]